MEPCLGVLLVDAAFIHLRSKYSEKWLIVCHIPFPPQLRRKLIGPCHPLECQCISRSRNTIERIQPAISIIITKDYNN